MKQNKIIASIDSISKDEGLALVNKSTLDEKIDKKKKHSFKLDVKKIKDNSYKFIKKKKIWYKVDRILTFLKINTLKGFRNFLIWQIYY